MIRSTLAACALAATATAVHATDGLITVQSPHSPQATMDRFASVVASKGMKVFARIDHAAGAASVGQSLRPTELIIFGNPKGGTPLMQCAQSAGIDLPLKAMVWQDDAGQTWLGYNDPVWIAARHGAADCAVVPAMAKALSAFSSAATAP
ncbi:DUF302 domain-containing protein [Nitrogeniibacter aestuarii]|uniref:DUF302 domain-containing protein n=1 Tax=Nitrogeniibacter aestuarii TaxID=2815343 RepID=UPI001E56C024|nr:DUF302 domain-containing protein [Nitrogeniibacter aestuarii]